MTAAMCQRRRDDVSAVPLTRERQRGQRDARDRRRQEQHHPELDDLAAVEA